MCFAKTINLISSLHIFDKAQRSKTAVPRWQRKKKMNWTVGLSLRKRCLLPSDLGPKAQRQPSGNYENIYHLLNSRVTNNYHALTNTIGDACFIVQPMSISYVVEILILLLYLYIFFSKYKIKLTTQFFKLCHHDWINPEMMWYIHDIGLSYIERKYIRVYVVKFSS